MSDRKRYVLAGAGGRGTYMYAKPLVEDFSHVGELVGVCDSNPLRMEALKRLSGATCPSYTDFDTMVAETKPDAAIVTTVDRFHHEYVVRSLDAGLDVIVEKPMTIDAEKCRAILEAEKRSGRRLTVTFNYRFAPYATAIKQAIRDGAIGKVLNVHFEWILDTSHGADYFRRWHRRMQNSGGLLVHKATHHFDIVNWWIEQEPVEVTAFGARRFYGPTRSERGDRCLTCEHKKTCEFYYDLSASDLNRILYLECEGVDGYHRDGCVFADEIDIYDTMSANVRYSGGAVMSYSLIAHAPYEGYKVSINGSEGRLEAAENHSGLRARDPAYYFDVYDRKGQKLSYTVPKSTGGHGGSDERLLRMVLEGGIPDPLGYQAGSFAGALSILVGVAANHSIAKGRNIKINDLVPLDEYRR